MHQQSETIVGAVFKLSPPAGILAAVEAGVSLQDWVLGATLLYTALMIVKLLWDWMVKPNLRKREP